MKARHRRGGGGQAYAVDTHRIADGRRSAGAHAGVDAQAPIGAVRLDGADHSDGFDDSGEHAVDYAGNSPRSRSKLARESVNKLPDSRASLLLPAPQAGGRAPVAADGTHLDDVELEALGETPDAG